MRGNICLAIPITILVLAGCVTQPRWVHYQVCFGLAREAEETIVSEEQWQQFRDEEILPRFPDGFTVLNAEGYWRSDLISHTEPSKVLIVVAFDNADTRRKIAEIAAAYKNRFRQESVLQIRSMVTVDFNVIE